MFVIIIYMGNAGKAFEEFQQSAGPIRQNFTACEMKRLRN
jgi:hypothetical protein